MRSLLQLVKRKLVGDKHNSGNNSQDRNPSACSNEAVTPGASKTFLAVSGSRSQVSHLLSRERLPHIVSVGDRRVSHAHPGTDDSGCDNPFAGLPLLKDVAVPEREAFFIKKLRACSVIYDFTRDTCIKQKEAKRACLIDIISYIDNTRNCFNENVMRDIVNTVACNIFRALPPAPQRAAIFYDPDEDDPVLECAWPHLQIVYEFFLRFVISNEVDARVVRRFIDHKFLLQFLELFTCEDPRERDYLKTILHRIYGKIMLQRAFIRKGIENIFYKLIYETDCHNGIGELLEILGSIVNGFALPLKTEHQNFLLHSIIPLHKARALNVFHSQLSYCILQYVEKDNSMSPAIIRGILRYWPVTNTVKEVLLINELEEILELTQPADFQMIMEPMFHRIAACIQSPHFQVAERVLFLWNNANILQLINSNRKVIFPIVVAALYKNSKIHCNNTVHGLTFNVSKVMTEEDPDLFAACSSRFVEEERSATKREAQRQKFWQQLEHAHQTGAKAILPSY